MANTLEQNPTYNRLFINSFQQATPIILGYIPVSFAYGVLAQEAGLSFLNTMLMSLIVYAGSSQLIAVGLISTGVSPISIVLTTFVVNLRHALMSASISPALRSWKKSEIAVFSYEITDESFAVHSLRTNRQEFIDAKHQKIEMLLVNLISHSSWLFGSWLGFSAGKLITDVKTLGIDFTLPAMFIALIIMQIENKRQLIILLLAGAMSTIFFVTGINQWNVILATVICATIGAFVEKWTKE